MELFTNRLDATEDYVAAVEKFIQEQIPAEDRQTIVSEIGLDADWSAAYTANSGQQDAVIRVQLTEERHLSAQQYAVQLRHALAERPEFSDLRVNFVFPFCLRCECLRALMRFDADVDRVLQDF